MKYENIQARELSSMCKILISLLPLICVFCSVLKCHSQERPVRILYFQSGAEAPSHAFVYQDDTMLAETQLPRSNFSESFMIPPGAVNLRFLPKKLVENDNSVEQSPQVSIPQTWNKVLILVFEDDTNEIMPIRMKAIDASDDVFGPGSICMINYSEIAVIGNVGQKELKLRPKSIQVITDPVDENGYYAVKLYGLTESGAKPRRFIKQMWGYDKSIRRVLFILPKPAPRYATYYSAPIRDF